MKKLTLTVLHNIFLTREERYSLYDEGNVKVTGVSLPVWIIENETSEPATEVFCKYKISSKNKKVSVRTYPTYYEINIPKDPQIYPVGIPKALWKSLSIEEKIKWKASEANLNLANLLDVKDGGSVNLCFRQFVKSKKRGKPIDIIHYVEIKDISELLESI